MITPIDLRIDDAAQPLGIDHDKPMFSWIPWSTHRAQTQQAYQILVASDESLLTEEKADLWNSGRVESNQTVFIPYAGSSMQSAQTCFWTVRLWNQDGACSDWSPATLFGTGILQPADWCAQWIGRGPQNEPKLDFDTVKGLESVEEKHGPIATEQTSALLRQEFTLDKPVRRATVFVCGLGFYFLHLNGKRVGENRHTPSKTDYRELVLYDAYDVTELLEDSSNAIGITLGNGWYNPSKRFWDWHMQWHGSKRALLQLQIEHDDGSITKVCTDPSWKTTEGPIREHCIYDGELYDARLEQAGWDCAGFDDSSWTAANVVEAPGGELQYHAIEPIRLTETIRPKTMWEVNDGVYLFDMGQNFSGIARLRVRGPRGTEIKFRHAENIHEDGTLDPATNNKALNLDQYILKGEGDEVYEPSFVYHGFRYLEISGYPGIPTLDSVDGRVLHTDSPQTGELHSSNDLINHIHRCTVWGQRSNMMGLPTDDNQRDERLGWMADGHLAAEQFMCNFEPTRFYRKWLRDMKYAQNPENGSVPYIVPRPFFSPDSQTPAWSSAYPLVAWYLYEYTDDLRILEEHLEPICRYVDYLSSLATDYILPKDHYGDHLSIADGHKRSDPLLSSTFYYYYDARLAADMAGILGRTDIQTKYTELAQKIRNAFNACYFNEETQSYGTGNQCEQILPLMLEMEPAGKRGNVFAYLINNIVAINQNHLRVGILGAKYALDLLMAENRHDVIWDWSQQEDYPSYGFMTKGYTTLSEAWDRTGTNNHVMWGHIDTWFYKGLAGIQCVPGTLGYETILFQPYIPKDLKWIRAALHTLRGRVACSWQRNQDQLQIDVTIPANTTAYLRLPAMNLRDNTIIDGSGKIVWDNKYIAGVDGILDGCISGEYVSLSLGSGAYRLYCEWRDIDLSKQGLMKSPWRSDFSKNWLCSSLQPAQDVENASCVSSTEALNWEPIDGTPFVSVHDRTQDADGLAYLVKRVRVDEDGEWLLHLGHDGGLRVFLDGDALFAEGMRVNPAPQMRSMIPLKLSAGEHELLIAFDTDHGMGWGTHVTLEIPTHKRGGGKQPVFPQEC